MKLFDCHAHYYDSKYNGIDGGFEAVVNSSEFRDKVIGVINGGTTAETSLKCIELAHKFEFMYATVGIHPEDCNTLPGTPEAEVAKIREILVNRKPEDKIVGIGEIGLDYYWQPYDRERELEFFNRQLGLAEEFDLPVVIHDREAHGDCFETVLKHPNVRGMFHCYSGSAEMARELYRRGWYISFGGVVTYKNAERVRAVAASVPTEFLLSETDCPYLAAHPHRGELNRSDYIEYTVNVLAQLHEMSSNEMSDILIENAKRFFNIQL